MNDAANDETEVQKQFRQWCQRIVLNLMNSSSSFKGFNSGAIGSNEIARVFIESDQVFELTKKFTYALINNWRQHMENHPEATFDQALDVPATKAPAPLGETDHTLIPLLSTPTQAAFAKLIPDLSEPDLPKTTAPLPAQQIAPNKASNQIARNFQLPNANIGQAYTGKIVDQLNPNTPLRIFDPRGLPEIGLKFDEETQALNGAPTRAGDHKITFQFSIGSNSKQTGECMLTINPDPRDLWQVNEPASDLPHRKNHTDSKSLPAGAYTIAAASRRGRSHEHGGSFRDDDFFVQHDTASGWSVVVVADGAGSAKYSRHGSELAVNAMGNHLFQELGGSCGITLSHAIGNIGEGVEVQSKSIDQILSNLFQTGGRKAIQEIETAASQQNCQPKLFATTLLAMVLLQKENGLFMATFWIGDGVIATYGPPEKIRIMGTPDSGEFAGQTRFLDATAVSDQTIHERMRKGFFSDLMGVMAMTDGVSDPYFETDKALHNPAKWEKFWAEVSPNLAAQKPEEALLEWLHFFIPGHHDDRTIVVFWPNKENK